MDRDEYRRFAVRAAEWGADYREGLRDRPVRPSAAPGHVARQLPAAPPEAGEAMEAIFADFEQVILPGMTHWQHPSFFAYFPANAAAPSVLAEILAAAMGAQCMIWQTSPAASELEGVTIDWLRQALGLPEGFSGTLQDSASTATFAAVLTMRETALAFAGNRAGLSGQPVLRLYASGEVHSSVEKAVWMSGIGGDNLVRIATTGPLRSMDAGALEAAILADRAAGLLPAGIIACTGGTGVGACDDMNAVADVAERQGLPLHVDAAWAGSAMICPEFRSLWAGVERADSIVVDPHKWLGAQFECSAHFVRDPAALVRTLAIRPEYLKTRGADGRVDYSEWSIPLGRRFRALKLWFLIRAYGLEGLRSRIRDHVAWTEGLAARFAASQDFEVVTAPVLSLFTFRPRGETADADVRTLALLEAVNADGRIYLTQTRVDGHTVIRFQAGSFETTEADVLGAFAVVCEVAARLASRTAPAA